MYILRRLLPFGVFSIGLELLYKTGLMAFEADKPDFAAAELLKTFGVMLLTTAIATLYMLIPYMLFLLALPAARRNGKLDRAVTVFMYASFVFALLFEKTASFVFWDEFSAAFNFIAVDYLVYTNEVIANIYQSYPVNLILSALLAATAAIVWLTKRFLFRLPEAAGRAADYLPPPFMRCCVWQRTGLSIWQIWKQTGIFTMRKFPKTEPTACFRPF